MSDETRSGATRPRDVKNWDTGTGDGQRGQSWLEYHRVIEYEDTRQRIERTRDLGKEIAVAEAELNAATRDLTEAEEKKTQHDVVVDAAEEDARKHQGEYSPKIGYLFWFIAALLVIADFPLAMLAAKGLGLPSTWERWSVGAGIALLALFFKIPFDPLMRRSYMLPAKLRALSVAAQIVVVVALSIYIAMNFRFLAEVRQEETAFETKLAQLNRPSGGIQAPNAAAALADLERRRQELQRAAGNAFLGIAVALPLAAAIFASAGSARIGNASQLRHLGAKREALITRIGSLRSMITILEGRLACLQEEQWAERSFPLLSDGRYRNYMHGYETGFVMDSAADVTPGSFAFRVRQRLSKWITFADRRQNEVLTRRMSMAKRWEADRKVGP